MGTRRVSLKLRFEHWVLIKIYTHKRTHLCLHTHMYTHTHTHTHSLPPPPTHTHTCTHVHVNHVAVVKAMTLVSESSSWVSTITAVLGCVRELSQDVDGLADYSLAVGLPVET